MTSASPSSLPFDALAQRALGLVPAPGSRALLGVAGSPGSGKTTLARAIAAAVNERAGEAVAAYLPMDGFHLANATLDALGRHERKGAIDTFDGWGFVALLRRILDERDNPVYAPAFERTVDEPVAGSIQVAPEVRLVVVEGNYLLAPQSPWDRIPALLAESWFVATPEEERVRRLVDRHTRHGRTPEAALAWACDVDGVNGRLIEATSGRATLIIDGTLPTGLTAGRS
ncbi:nucleoside/nucleotide kinase family protein [Leifsonia sp. F6_8S_P_1B]|uniref:Nucleoside/nucleotide kinase family protein n=1 Tax=Leifsonia williamsii TaxID=3035919 RepID=A0ABT8K8C9_9MICO|nr:nucleoside/nucleotide kinase family protein [Leifsonia williamsii]MDN4613721.1 nucleoside/nucleotide kinase family protein [Leifsonia williamsii]